MTTSPDKGIGVEGGRAKAGKQCLRQSAIITPHRVSMYDYNSPLANDKTMTSAIKHARPIFLSLAAAATGHDKLFCADRLRNPVN